MSRLNELHNLELNHHDINFLYGICGTKRIGYYLKIRDPIVRLISYLILTQFSIFNAISKSFKADFDVVHVQDLNFVLRSEIFVHYNGQFRDSHLILDYVASYTSYQDPRSALTVSIPCCLKFTFASQDSYRGASPLAPISDDFRDTIFQGRVDHITVEEPIDTGPDATMVEQHHMSIKCYFSKAQIARSWVAPPQPPPLVSRGIQKSQRTADEPSRKFDAPPFGCIPHATVAITANP